LEFLLWAERAGSRMAKTAACARRHATGADMVISLDIAAHWRALPESGNNVILSERFMLSARPWGGH